MYISSDGVFDGEKTGGLYRESDIPRPVTPYGVNLCGCESLVKCCVTDYLIVRPSYIFGHSLGTLDSRLSCVKDTLKKRGVVERFTDMYKSPMHVNQTAQIIIDLVMSNYNGIVHVAGDRMSIYDFILREMKYLGVSIEKFRGVPMPKKSERPIDFLPDTSLNCSLMRKYLNDIN